MIELYIVLSDLCNFSCSHCINTSGPNAKKWRFQPQEVVRLTQFINSHLEIKKVHFSGGEPTLHESLIKEIQSGISRTLDYSITSNGWLGEKLDGFLERIKLDSIVLSYDKFHVPFINIKTLVSFIEQAKRRALPVTVNFTFEDVGEIAIAKPLVEAGASLQTCKLVNSGRAGVRDKETQTFFPNSINGTCPSLEREKNGDLEKVVYVPGLGLTPCCGPLAFDRTTRKTELYSDLNTDYSKNKLRRKLDKKNFIAVLRSKGIDTTGLEFNSRCDACSWLHSDSIGEHSIYDILENSVATIFIKTPTPLDEFSSKILQQCYVVSHFFIRDTDEFTDNTEQYSSLEEKELTDDHKSDIELFVRDNYYKPNRQFYSDHEINAHCSGLNDYLKSGATGLLHYKNRKLVSVILKNFYASHRANGRPSTHVGYWGISRELVSKNESSFIKSSWMRFLNDPSSPSIQIDCSIEWFNSVSISFAKKVGFKFFGMRLDMRGLK